MHPWTSMDLLHSFYQWSLSLLEVLVLCGAVSLLRAPQTTEHSYSPRRPCRSSLAVDLIRGRALDESVGVLGCLVSNWNRENGLEGERVEKESSVREKRGPDDCFSGGKVWFDRGDVWSKSFLVGGEKGCFLETMKAVLQVPRVLTEITAVIVIGVGVEFLYMFFSLFFF